MRQIQKNAVNPPPGWRLNSTHCMKGNLTPSGHLNRVKLGPPKTPPLPQRQREHSSCSAVSFMAPRKAAENTSAAPPPHKHTLSRVPPASPRPLLGEGGSGEVSGCWWRSCRDGVRQEPVSQLQAEQTRRIISVFLQNPRACLCVFSCSLCCQKAPADIPARCHHISLLH